MQCKGSNNKFLFAKIVLLIVTVVSLVGVTKIIHLVLFRL